MLIEFDVIVVGAGHAGAEAAAAAAKLGVKVLLISMDLSKIAQMSCNPAMGGVAKGQIVREIDALGGLSGWITDQSSIQFRMLNRSKGPAMWSPRAQCDRMKFSEAWRDELESIENLYLWQDNVIQLIVEKNTIKGVRTQLGTSIKSRTVILTNGTFLSGLIHVGEVNYGGGRAGEQPSNGLTEQLVSLGFEVGRMKTGTPVRVDGRTVDLTKLIEQKGEEEHRFFSYRSTKQNSLIQRSCYIAHTSEEVHNKLQEGFELSPLFKGIIRGIGPRYCPSIEDKIRTFSDKSSHQLFLEPEGEKTYEMYLNGFSSSLPADIQFEALKKIEGFKNVHILRPGYAIEYDYFPPTQLKHTLETKLVQGLFFAGQVNGTTGYEEAAAQGLIAGINAALHVKKEKQLILLREEAYIGVLIDDLITKGVDEPYRMFTSRAEYRVLLRQDNADERLMPMGYKLGLINQNQYIEFIERQKETERILEYISTTSISPAAVNPYLNELNSSPLSQTKKLVDIALRPEVNILELLKVDPKIEKLSKELSLINREVLESVEIKIKYGGYIQREKLVAEKLQRLENLRINSDFEYNKLNSLSTEARQKLTRIKPETVGQASRIPGVSPSDINVLLVYLGR